LFLLLPRRSWQERRSREIQTQTYRSHKSMSNSLPIAWKAPPTYTSHPICTRASIPGSL
jgi:hypothetical protein